MDFTQRKTTMKICFKTSSSSIFKKIDTASVFPLRVFAPSREKQPFQTAGNPIFNRENREKPRKESGEKFRPVFAFFRDFCGSEFLRVPRVLRGSSRFGPDAVISWGNHALLEHGVF
jgi:hypothetical protein